METKPTISRKTSLIVSLITWLIGVPLVHAGIPYAISWRTAHLGWVDGRPAWWNYLGLIPVAAGLVCLGWVMKMHLSRTPQKTALDLTPPYLLQSGPYRFSRNPMFVAEIAMWLGWVAFYGSIGVLVVTGVLWASMQFMAIPREERALEYRFGGAYLQYKRSTPRWIGVIHRS